MIKNPDKYQKGKTIVYFIRHAEKIKSKYDNDPGLTVRGVRQSEKLSLELQKINPTIDKIYTSTKNRARETAVIIEKRLGRKSTQEERLNEFNAIVWRKEWWKIRFWKNYIKYHEATKYFDKILLQHNGKVIVFVCHGNVIKGIIGKKLGLRLKKIKCFNIHNACITQIYFKNKDIDYIQFYDSLRILPNTYN